MRLAIQNDLIEKAYIINYMDKVYKIKEVKDTSPVTYIVVDDQGIQHKGSFYEQDLQKRKENL